MDSKINIPKSWKIPKYQLGQRVKQGEIIGIEYRIPGTNRAYELGIGWVYTVLPNNYSDSVEIIQETEIKLATPESHQEIRDTINAYNKRISTLAEQLDQES